MENRVNSDIIDNIENTDSDTLAVMKNTDIRTVDPETLVDISDVKIDVSKPKSERISDFIRQIKNPYCFKCGKVIIKTSFSDTDLTLESCFKSFLTGL